MNSTGKRRWLIVNWRKLLHHALAVLFFMLLVSGFLLHFSLLRGPLAEHRLLLVRLHGYAGELFSIAVAAYLILMSFSPGLLQAAGRHKWVSVCGFAGMVAAVSSGWILLLKSHFGPVITVYFFDLHRWLAYFAVPAVLFHVWIAWAKPLPEVTNGTRRRFFGWLATILTGLWAASVGWRLFAEARPQDVKSNANCDVFLPSPEPSPESLPPIGGGLRGPFGEYSVAGFLPCLNHETWRFTIDGLVARPITFDWNDFVRLPRRVQVSDFHCVEGWSVFNITYEGLLVSDLLKITGVKPEATWVKFYSADGHYMDALSLEQARLPDVMIAMLMDGKPISRVLGGPARLIVPKMYAYKAVKWVERIELISEPFLGYWEWYGFDRDAWVGKN